MRLDPRWTPHAVEVETWVEGANGSGWGPLGTVHDVYVEEVQEVVVDDSGAEVVSSGRVIFNFEDCPDKGSRITVWPGTGYARKAVMFKVARFDHPDWPSYAIGYLR